MAKSENKKDILERLTAKAKAAPKRATNIWDPKEGETLAGIVTKMKRIPGRQKDDDGKVVKYLSCQVVDTHGESFVVNCGTLLQDEMEEQGVQPGWTVAIVYNGSEKTGGGNDIHLYSLASEAPQ